MPFSSQVANISNLGDVPFGLWIVWTSSLAIALAVGFSAGLLFEKLAVARSFRRASREASRLIQLVTESLDRALRACSLLEKFPNATLSSEQSARLDKQRGGLLDSVSRILSKVRPEAITSRPEPKRAGFQMDWIRAPEDAVLGIPDRAAFDANLAALLVKGAEAQAESGLLLAKIDRFDQLCARFGADGAQQLLRKATVVICKCMRDVDIVCRFSNDTAAVLMPDIDQETGRELASRIFTQIRNHVFRLVESGPEVLVTASFGYTRCLPLDHPDLVLNRAGNALARSQKVGRNQLHLLDGERMTHYAAT